jgi:hypothetical protein
VTDKKSVREAKELLHRVELVRPPMPGKSAADAQWDAWAELQHLQAMLAGFVSQLASGKVRDRDLAGYAKARAVRSDRRLGELLGDRISDAEQSPRPA